MGVNWSLLEFRASLLDWITEGNESVCGFQQQNSQQIEVQGRREKRTKSEKRDLK